MVVLFAVEDEIGVSGEEMAAQAREIQLVGRGRAIRGSVTYAIGALAAMAVIMGGNWCVSLGDHFAQRFEFLWRYLGYPIAAWTLGGAALATLFGDVLRRRRQSQ